MSERLWVREIGDDEGQRLLRILRRGTGSVVTWRQAQMVLLSAQVIDAAAIARVAFTSEDRVRDVIRNFSADGFASLYPKYRGGRPPKFTLGQRREVKKVARSHPGDHGLPFSAWSLSKLAAHVREDQAGLDGKPGPLVTHSAQQWVRAGSVGSTTSGPVNPYSAPRKSSRLVTSGTNVFTRMSTPQAWPASIRSATNPHMPLLVRGRGPAILPKSGCLSEAQIRPESSCSITVLHQLSWSTKAVGSNATSTRSKSSA